MVTDLMLIKATTNRNLSILKVFLLLWVLNWLIREHFDSWTVFSPYFWPLKRWSVIRPACCSQTVLRN